MFKSYSDFLLALLSQKYAKLRDNCDLLEKVISIKNCYEMEPHLFEAFVSQCNKEMTAVEKEMFQSFVKSYFLLKSNGFFEQSASISISPKTVTAYTSQFLTDKKTQLKLD